LKKGFTLLELMIVVVIIGILASVAIPSYSSLVERGRGAEARQVLSYLRARAIEFYNENPAGGGTAISNADLRLDQNGAIAEGEVPGASCQTSHYFRYTINSSDANSIVLRAIRCTADGKFPDTTGNKFIQININLVSGGAGWTTSAPY